MCEVHLAKIHPAPCVPLGPLSDAQNAGDPGGLSANCHPGMTMLGTTGAREALRSPESGEMVGILGKRREMQPSGGPGDPGRPAAGPTRAGGRPIC